MLLVPAELGADAPEIDEDIAKLPVFTADWPIGCNDPPPDAPLLEDVV